MKKRHALKQLAHVPIKLFTGSAGGSPAMSAQREQKSELEYFGRSSHLAVLGAGEPPAVPVKSLSGQAHSLLNSNQEMPKPTTLQLNHNQTVDKLLWVSQQRR